MKGNTQKASKPSKRLDKTKVSKKNQTESARYHRLFPYSNPCMQEEGTMFYETVDDKIRILGCREVN